MKPRYPNVAKVELVAGALGDLRERLLFVGGCAVDLLLTDTAAAPSRVTYDVDAGSLVDEQWLLDLERKHFMELLATDKTQARIEHMLKNGKPLRN